MCSLLTHEDKLCHFIIRACLAQIRDDANLRALCLVVSPQFRSDGDCACFVLSLCMRPAISYTTMRATTSIDWTDELLFYDEIDVV